MDARHWRWETMGPGVEVTWLPELQSRAAIDLAPLSYENWATTASKSIFRLCAPLAHLPPPIALPAGG